MKPAPAARWDADKDAQVRQLKLAGRTDRQVARALGLTIHQIRKRRRALGDVLAKAGRPKALPPMVAKVRDLRQRGYSIAAISRKLDLEYGWVRSTIDQHEQEQAGKTPAAVDDDALVARLMADGGLPHARVLSGRTVWLGPDNRPWFDPDQRRDAA